jgi:hypothetical protein
VTSVPGVRLKRALIFVHRWLGVALCLIFLLWFPSGLVMMYWDFPSISPGDRLERAPALDVSKVRLSPAEAYDALGVPQPPTQVTLLTVDGRPAYRFRAGRETTLVYADTGEEQGDVSLEMMQRAASAWTGQPVNAAKAEQLEEVDQWTLQGQFRNERPLWKYTWPGGEQVYVSGTSGEVVQYTTTASRLGAYFGAIPHWMYFTPLRKHGPQWSSFVIWSSGIAAGSATLGLIIGIWMYSPSKRYRNAGTPTSIPYRGQKRWHTLLGLIFGVGAVTWAFSGMLSMEPFPLTRPGAGSTAGGAAGGRRGAGTAGIPQAFRGRPQLPAFATKPPSDALLQLRGLQVKEMELTSFAGDPVYLATLRPGETRIVPVDGELRTEFDRQQVMDVATKAAQPAGLAELRLLDRYDRYYLDRHHERPLPVVLARLNDADGTRYYIDPKTGRIVGSYSARSWMERWLYHGLHSFDFPWLYNYRPAWDIVVIAFMVGGTALCVTSLILAWRVVGRKIALVAGTPTREASFGEDLA